jgi:putative DNA primase/helicase
MSLVPPLLTLSGPAFKVWRELHDEVEVSLSHVGEFGSVPDVGAKIAEYAARIAGIFHVVEHGPEGSIDAATMQNAAILATWHLNEARRILGSSKTPQDVSDAALLFEWLLDRPKDLIEHRSISNLGPNPLRDKLRRDAALTVLMERHLIRETRIGRAVRLEINPKARQAYEPR